MMIRRDDVVGLRGNGAIAEFVIIRVHDDYAESELRFDEKNVRVKIKQQRQESLDLLPARATRQRGDCLLVFQQDFIRDCQINPSGQKRFANRTPCLIAAKELHQRVRVNAHPHGA